MPPQTFMFIGRSGCGKGTQAAFLHDYIKKQDPKREILAIETGAKIRAFIANEKGYAAELSREIYDAGGLQPGFLTAWIWSSVSPRWMIADDYLPPVRIYRKARSSTSIPKFIFPLSPFFLPR